MRNHRGRGLVHRFGTDLVAGTERGFGKAVEQCRHRERVRLRQVEHDVSDVPTHARCRAAVVGAGQGFEQTGQLVVLFRQCADERFEI